MARALSRIRSLPLGGYTDIRKSGKGIVRPLYGLTDGLTVRPTFCILMAERKKRYTEMALDSQRNSVYCHIKHFKADFAEKYLLGDLLVGRPVPSPAFAARNTKVRIPPLCSEAEHDAALGLVVPVAHVQFNSRTPWYAEDLNHTEMTWSEVLPVEVIKFARSELPQTQLVLSCRNPGYPWCIAEPGPLNGRAEDVVARKQLTRSRVYPFTISVESKV